MLPAGTEHPHWPPSLLSRPKFQLAAESNREIERQPPHRESCPAKLARLWPPPVHPPKEWGSPTHLETWSEKKNE